MTFEKPSAILLVSGSLEVNWESQPLPSYRSVKINEKITATHRGSKAFESSEFHLNTVDYYCCISSYVDILNVIIRLHGNMQQK